MWWGLKWVTGSRDVIKTWESNTKGGGKDESLLLDETPEWGVVPFIEMGIYRKRNRFAMSNVAEAPDVGDSPRCHAWRSSSPQGWNSFLSGDQATLLVLATLSWSEIEPSLFPRYWSWILTLNSIHILLRVSHWGYTKFRSAPLCMVCGL